MTSSRRWVQNGWVEKAERRQSRRRRRRTVCGSD
jgi:hypothetical protein